MDDQLELRPGLVHRQDQVLADQVLGDKLHIDLVCHARGGKVDKLHPELVGDRLGDLPFRGVPLLDHDLAEAFARAFGCLGGLFDLIGVHHAPGDEDFTELLA